MATRKQDGFRYIKINLTYQPNADIVAEQKYKKNTNMKYHCGRASSMFMFLIKFNVRTPIVFFFFYL